jgi:hypothetical protein
MDCLLKKRRHREAIVYGRVTAVALSVPTLFMLLYFWSVWYLGAKKSWDVWVLVVGGLVTATSLLAGPLVVREEAKISIYQATKIGENKELPLHTGLLVYKVLCSPFHYVYHGYVKDNVSCDWTVLMIGFRTITSIISALLTAFAMFVSLFGMLYINFGGATLLTASSTILLAIYGATYAFYIPMMNGMCIIAAEAIVYSQARLLLTAGVQHRKRGDAGILTEVKAVFLDGISCPCSHGSMVPDGWTIIGTDAMVKEKDIKEKTCVVTAEGDKNEAMHVLSLVLEASHRPLIIDGGMCWNCSVAVAANARFDIVIAGPQNIDKKTQDSL